jgi:hypothetical protein
MIARISTVVVGAVLKQFAKGSINRFLDLDHDNGAAAAPAVLRAHKPKDRILLDAHV